MIEHHHSDVGRPTNCVRAAARILLEGEEWGKRQLVTWLEGPYREVTVAPSRESEMPPRESTPPPSRRSSIHPVAESTVAILLIQTRNDVVGALEHLVTGDASFVRSSLASGAIRKCEDEEGIPFYAAVHRPGMKLVDRVLALFAADYLNDPGDYHELLTVCEQCGHVSFEGECVHVDSGFFAPGAEDDEQPFELVSFIQAG